MKRHFEPKECKQIIQNYIAREGLQFAINDDERTKPLKGGQIRIDPTIYNLLKEKPKDGGVPTVRIDQILKGIDQFTTPAYIVAEVDPNTRNLMQQQNSTNPQNTPAPTSTFVMA